MRKGILLKVAAALGLASVADVLKSPSFKSEPPKTTANGGKRNGQVKGKAHASKRIRSNRRKAKNKKRAA